MFVTKDKKGNFRPFCCDVPELETALDALNSIVATGEVAVKVDLISNGQKTSLPPEAFDGELMGTHIQQLENDWKAVLNKPVNPKADFRQLLSHSSNRLHQTYQVRINWLEAAIIQTENLIQQAQQTLCPESYLPRLEMQLSQYQRQLQQAQNGLQEFRQRLAPYITY